MSIIHDFPSIARKLNRQEQKAEFEAKNPKPETPYNWIYGVATPMVMPISPHAYTIFKEVLAESGTQVNARFVNVKI